MFKILSVIVSNSHFFTWNRQPFELIFYLSILQYFFEILLNDFTKKNHLFIFFYKILMVTFISFN